MSNTKILFTKKKLDKKLISEKLGNQFVYDFFDVLKISNIKVEKFNLKNKSIIFSSVNAVESFFENGFEPNEKFTDKNYNKIYCIGKKTKKKIRSYGYGTFKVKKHAKDLAQFIYEYASKEKFLHFCGNLALDIIDVSQPLQNVYYKKLVVYETQLLCPTFKESYDALVFFSPSGVRSYLKNNNLENKKIFSIGNTTTNELKKFTSQKILTSKESNLDDLLNLICKTYKNK